VSELDFKYKNGTVEEKWEIISSIFLENIVFDGERHRTPKVNEAILLIYQKKKELDLKKKSQIAKKRLVPYGAPNGTRLEHFIAGFEETF